MKQFLRFGLIIAFLAISGWGYAQSIIDFEIVGNEWTWNAFENGANTGGSFTVTANPDATGINTSATCGKMIVNADGAIYAGVESKHGVDIGSFTFDANNSSIKMMVYKSVISPVGLKFAENNGEAQPEVKVSNTKINEWEELIFDLSGSIGKGITGIIDQIIIFPDFPDTRTDGSVCYVDNIKFGDLAPTVNVSKHGFAFEGPGGDKTFKIGTAIAWTVASDQTWLTVSSASGTGDASITLTATENDGATARTATVTVTGGDATTQTIAVTQEGFVAAPTTSATTPPVRDALNVISIFSDAYTSIEGTNFNPGWGQSTVVTNIQLGTDTVLKYGNLNYQGTEFTDVNADAMGFLHIDVWTADETSLQVFCISRSTGEKAFILTPINLNVWNSYNIPLTVYTDQGLSLADLFQFKIVGSGGKTVYLDNMYFYKEESIVDTEAPTAFTATAGTITSESVELLLTATDNSGAVSYTVSYGSGPTVLTTSGVSAVAKSYVVTGLTASTAYSFSVSAEDAAGNTATNNPLVVSATTLAAVPAAPTPTMEASKVLSIYSDTYTNVAGTNFAPSWGQSTQGVEVQLSSNNTLKYTSFNYMGIELASNLDASAMTTLHIDIYTPDETNISITPISSGPVEFAVVLTPLTQNVWNSYDIPLSSFTGVAKSDIFQFKFDGGTGKSFYMDNLYLYGESTAVINQFEKSNITIYPNPVNSKLFVDGLSQNATIKIFDMGGKLLVKKHNVDKAIDLDKLTKGIYFIQISDDNSITTRKFIKE